MIVVPHNSCQKKLIITYAVHAKRKSKNNFPKTQSNMTEIYILLFMNYGVYNYS